MTLRSLGLAMFLVSMAVACEQKMAPTDEPSGDDNTTQDSTSSMPADGDDAKDEKGAPADKGAAPTPAPAPARSETTPAPAPAKTDAPAPAKTDGAKNDTNPADVGACLAECKDPDCFSKCFGSFGGGGDNPFGF